MARRLLLFKEMLLDSVMQYEEDFHRSSLTYYTIVNDSRRHGVSAATDMTPAAVSSDRPSQRPFNREENSGVWV